MEKIGLGVCLAYWLLTVLRKKGGGEFGFGFLGGWMIAFFSFCFLPPVFGCENVIFATICALAGTLLGTWAEKIGNRHIWEAVSFTGAMGMFLGWIGQNTAIAAALGGFSLYLACGAILTENGQEKENIKSGLGGALGFLCGILSCFYE